ncbi:MAG: hypothetical protein HYZ14_01095 [Bacteroidetes bacterium]|nr:hypothetical protein [Bacteroidota bacterium]
MLKGLLTGVFFVSLVSLGQIHNRVLKFNAGVTYDQFARKSLFDAINDTSSAKFESVTTMPYFACSHEMVLNNVLSISGHVGFQYLNEYYDNHYYGSPFLLFSINPQISVFYRKGFEYYVKLQAGITCWFQHSELLTDQQKKYFPDKVNLFTGVTLGGFNFFLTDHLGLNLELNLWSPEMATFGITYRYFKGELPAIEETKEM